MYLLKVQTFAETSQAAARRGGAPLVASTIHQENQESGLKYRLPATCQPGGPGKRMVVLRRTAFQDVHAGNEARHHKKRGQRQSAAEYIVRVAFAPTPVV